MTGESELGEVVKILEEAREWGFLGPGPVADQVAHALAFALIIDRGAVPTHAVDLGCGGGLPGLVLATRYRHTSWVFVDAHRRRIDFLADAVQRLRFAHCRVVCERAEILGRDIDFRRRFDLVVTRGFGPPAVTAECAAPFLGIGGRVLVSEPPGSDRGRWSEPGLAQLGLALAETAPGPPAFQVLVQESLVSERFPRRVGVPTKRPIF